ncbi:MAG TPA: hypothetical protein PLA43_10020 [Bryobacteraceae bacterium]|nr:hypothetical protein [Bryobacteraceae bacterium]HOL73161.1 hypothetical protein [Bryobacteraceae bacterium]HOQ46280.1 hypothetical protein [Bryobacteraceae bacterium]HPU72283.1 hypothetical protein [Bryobacteraceae bacterium]
MGSILSGIKRFVLWDYPRASWQYDVMVGLILAFIFLTPREWFRDQPRVPRASKVAMLQGEQGASVFWLESELLLSVPESERAEKALKMVASQTGEAQELIRLVPVFDSEKEIKGFMAFTRPQTGTLGR